MKVFDSGMPGEAYWNSLFDIRAIVAWLCLESLSGPLVEIGCGYGTFTVPVARLTTHVVHAFDIEQDMIRTAGENVSAAGLENVEFHRRDVIAEGTGLLPGSTDLVLLFNILHSPERVQLLTEASRILKVSGRIAVIHWRRDIPTPRGPRTDSRPDEKTILDSIEDSDVKPLGRAELLPPYHWGMQLRKEGNEPPRSLP